jgi:hypothetical protein
VELWGRKYGVRAFDVRDNQSSCNAISILFYKPQLSPGTRLDNYLEKRREEKSETIARRSRLGWASIH